MIGEDTLIWAIRTENTGIVILLLIVVVILAWRKGKILKDAYVHGIDSLQEDWNHVVKLLGAVIGFYFILGESSTSGNTVAFIVAVLGAVLVYSKFSNSVRKQVSTLRESSKHE